MGQRKAELEALSSLDPLDWNGLRQQAHRMLDDVLDSLEGVRGRPIWQPIPEAVRARFRSPLPINPTPLAEVHDEFLASILPYTARNAHPGFMGWAQGGGSPVGMLAEMVAAGLNANAGGRDQIPLEVERQLTEWMRSIFHFPIDASGLVVTGTSMANFLAVVIARNAALGAHVRRQGLTQRQSKLSAYASVEVHNSLTRALDMAGLGIEALRLIPTNSRFQIDPNALRERIETDRAAGFTPFLVIGTAGTVNTAGTDDLNALADICKESQLWFHVDGACGALAMLVPQLSTRLAGIERADSLAFDFHKWAQVPYDAGFLLVRDGARHQQAFRSPCSYLDRDERGMMGGSPWPCDLGLELSRGFRALKIWTSLKTYGTDAIGAVIRQTCSLAQHLERRITAEPELELMAPVELNVVCFRYRFAGIYPATPDAAPDPGSGETHDRLNREIVFRLHEGGETAPSTTVLHGQVVIRAAIVNHRTVQADVDVLLDRVLAFGRALREAAVSQGQTQAEKWKPRIERDAQREQIEALLSVPGKRDKNVEVALRFHRARLLLLSGEHMEARTEFLRVLELDPTHLKTMVELGGLLLLTRQVKAARILYAEAVRQYPDNLVCRVNLGGALLTDGEPAPAREQYEVALTISPDHAQANCGMYYALTRLEQYEAAKVHQQRGFSQQPVITKEYRGSAQPIPVLLLVSSTGGNAPLEALLDDCVYLTHVVIADFCNSSTPLPEHKLILNAIGDIEAAEEALSASESLLQRASAPILNRPELIRATARCENARRFSHIPGLVTPRTVMFPFQVLAQAHGATELARHGFEFPLLLRAPGYHMGQHFIRVNSAEALEAALAQMPGQGLSDMQLLAIQYLDARGSDGLRRKYRTMTVGGELFPLHLAISPHWKIHYFSADMADRPDHREEEARFLDDMPGVLGGKAMRALERVQAELGLDYGGIDFGLNLEGDVLLFEANATMVAEHPPQDPCWDYRRAAVTRIHTAVHSMLRRTSAAA